MEGNKVYDNTQIFAESKQGIVPKEEMKVRFRSKCFVPMI
jgi:hypothetical protein